MTMQDRGKSELIGKRFRLEGFAIEPHPLDRGKRVQVTIFSVMPDETEHVICLSDVAMRQVKRHRRQLRNKLGMVVDDSLVVRNVQRAFAPADLEQAKAIIAEGWPGSFFRWWEGRLHERN